MNNLLIESPNSSDAISLMQLIALADADAMIDIAGVNTLDEAIHRYADHFHDEHMYFYQNNFLVARQSDILCGCILFFNGQAERQFQDLHEKMHPKRTHYDAELNEVYIDSIAVKDEFRGQGIAKQLIQAVIADSKKKGFEKINLDVDTKKTELIHFYEKQGFIKMHQFKVLNDNYYRMTLDLATR